MKIIFILNFILFITALSAQDLNVRYRECEGCCDVSQCNDGGDATLYTYQGVNNFTAQQVTSDFAPRPRDNAYDWHGGIDLSSGAADDDKGDLIMPIETGTMVRLGPDSHGFFKYLVIQGDGGHYFGYGHLFTSSALIGIGPNDYQRNGNVVLKRRSDITTQFAILFIDETPIRAIGIGTGGTVEWGGNTYIVNNNINNANLPICAIGDSHTGYNNNTHDYIPSDVPAHLHLFLFADGSLNPADGKTKNPLDVLTYPAPEYAAATTVTDGFVA